MRELLGKWEDNVKLVFSKDEMVSILKEFVRVAYGLSEKDVSDITFEYAMNSYNTRELTQMSVLLHTKNARPESWESYTYRDVVKKEK